MDPLPPFGENNAYAPEKGYGSSNSRPLCRVTWPVYTEWARCRRAPGQSTLWYKAIWYRSEVCLRPPTGVSGFQSRGRSKTLIPRHQIGSVQTGSNYNRCKAPLNSTTSIATISAGNFGNGSKTEKPILASERGAYKIQPIVHPQG